MPKPETFSDAIDTVGELIAAIRDAAESARERRGEAQELGRWMSMQERDLAAGGGWN